MALKNVANTARFFVVDTATGLGVAGLTVGAASFTTIKLDQDGTLGSDIKATITLVDDAAGFYSFALSAAQMNFGSIIPIVVPATATYQAYGYNVTTEATGDSYAVANSRLPAALTANGNIKASLVEILTTAITETAGYLAAGFKKFFNIETPVLTVASVNQGADNNVILASASKGLVKVYDDMSKPGTAQTITAPADMALNSTVAKDATVSKPGIAQTITAPATMATAAELAKVKGAVAGKKIINAAGTQVQVFDSTGVLLVTLDRTGTTEMTWTPTWA